MMARKTKADKLLIQANEIANKLDYTAALLGKLGNPIEWESTGECFDAGERSEQHCACGHLIRYIFPIFNPRTGKREQVGSTCIEHFENVNQALFENLMKLAGQLDEKIATEQAAIKIAQDTAEISALKMAWSARYTEIDQLANAHREARKRLPYELWYLWTKTVEHSFPQYKRVHDYRRWCEKQHKLLDKAFELFDQSLKYR